MVFRTGTETGTRGNFDSSTMTKYWNDQVKGILGALLRPNEVPGRFVTVYPVVR
jgi:hypothetical protein